MDERRIFPVVDEDAVLWLTAAQMREIDRIATEDLGIELIQMMENAGRSLAEVVLARFRPRAVTVLAGRGGNGGGGLAAARHLVNRGVAVRVVLAEPAEAFGDAPRRQLEIVERIGLPISERPSAADVVVDALLGYSARGDPRGRVADLVRWAMEGAAPIVALDLPTGLDATTGAVGVPCVRAAATVTLAMPKVGLRRRADVVGELFLADISVPAVAYRRIGLEPAAPFGPSAIVRIA